MKKIILFTFVLLLINNILICADVEDHLNTLNAQMAKSYLKPFNKTFAGNLSHNWYIRPPRPVLKYWEWGFHLVGIGNTTPNDDKYMSGTTNYQFSREQAYSLLKDVNDPVTKMNLSEIIINSSYSVDFEGPTFMGSNNQNIVLHTRTIWITQNDVIIHTIPAQDLEIAATGVWKNYELYGNIVPQFDFGTFLGTNISIRWMPEYSLASNSSGYSVLGGCISHNPEMWLKLASDRVLPFEITGQAYYQKTKYGDFVEISDKGYAAFISRTFHERELNWMPYIGLNIGNISSEYDYTVTIKNEDEDWDKKNTTRHYSFEYDDIQYMDITVGNTLRFWCFDLNVDYTFADDPYFSTKIGVSKIW